MLNSAMCLPPTLNFFPSPRGTSWISDTFRNTATAHLLKRTLLASCTAQLWPFQRLHTRVGPSWGGQVPAVLPPVSDHAQRPARASQGDSGCREANPPFVNFKTIVLEFLNVEPCNSRG